ncbi:MULTISPECIES: hypothetical protein [Lelliottia]|uniref:hypothetical protein n=1 Tax=Lelliottia TaxID=1330545 RepID=UPI001E447B43|nr:MULTISPECIES: hypothetical protein [Lelliottia]
MNKAIIKAAQVRAFVAVKFSNLLLWRQAKALMKAGMQPDGKRVIYGQHPFYRNVHIHDAAENYESFGDCSICDGDMQRALLTVNMELPDETFKKEPPDLRIIDVGTRLSCHCERPSTGYHSGCLRKRIQMQLS